ncbi:MAG: hypothetical protein ABNH00_03960 [Dokdonia sp.]|jgi:hypothetical protein
MGTTATPTPIVHIYKEVNIGKYSSVRHFELHNVDNGKPVFEPKVQLAKNRNFAKSSPIFWFTHHKQGKWVKPFITGLFTTPETGIYKGDVNRKRHLTMFSLSDNNTTLTVYFFKEFYTEDEYFLNQLFNKYCA